jgi:RNA polymerase sigma-70 factor (ECF subfamily)
MEKLQEMVINKAVIKLPEKQRIVLILRIYHGLSHKEISEILTCSVRAVKAHYFHAIRNLRKSIKPHNTFEKNLEYEM